MNLTDIMLFGKAINGGGDSGGGSGGAKIATFDFAKWDEYEKCITGIEGVNFVKISDEMPTADELIGGFISEIYDFISGNHDTKGINAYRADTDHLRHDEEVDNVLIARAFDLNTVYIAVFSETASELMNAMFESEGIEARLTPGIWMNAEEFIQENARGEWFAALVWGF